MPNDKQLREEVDILCRRLQNCAILHQGEKAEWNDGTCITREMFKDEIERLFNSHTHKLLERVSNEVIGEREQRETVICTCWEDENSEHRLTTQPTIIRNNLRAEQRQKLNNIKSDNEEGE